MYMCMYIRMCHIYVHYGPNRNSVPLAGARHLAGLQAAARGLSQRRRFAKQHLALRDLLEEALESASHARVAILTARLANHGLYKNTLVKAADGLKPTNHRNCR